MSTPTTTGGRQRMRRAIAFFAASTMALSGAVVAATPSTADESVSVGGLPDGGTVLIQTGFGDRTGRVTTTIKDKEGTSLAPIVQTVRNNTCDRLSAGPVAITANRKACFKNKGFGVNRGLDGVAAYPRSKYRQFLNPNTKRGEKLSISLTDEATVDGRELVFLGPISLDIEAVRVGRGSDMRLTAYRDGKVVQSTAINLAPRIVRFPPNYRVSTTLTEAADRIELTALRRTRFQLEGDTNGKQGSSFTLAQITDVVQCDGAPVTLDNGASLTVGGQGCSNEPIVFEVDDDGDVLLLKEPSEAEYTLRYPFTTTRDPLARVLVDYDVDGSAPFRDVLSCRGSTDDPALVGDPNPDTAVIDGFCEAARTTSRADGVWTVDVTLFGVNDPKFRFR